MWVCQKNNTLLLAITLGILIASGCSGHSVRYGANSEGEEMTSSESGSAMGTDGTMRQADGSVEDKGINRGLVNGANPYLRSNNMNPDGSAKAWNPNSSNREATAEANGMASNTNPDPESWANAYLGKGQSSRDFYGDPSKSGTSYGGPSTDGVNPTTWAENYTKENGGPSPEYINPDMSIAQGNGSQPGGTGGSVGIGRTNANESADASSFSHAMGASQGNVQDIYFDFDSWNISADAAKYLEEGAHWLQAHPGKALTIEGHCDQRGTQDYNLVLGQKRADAAREYLINLGVQPDRVKIVSYGKERPFCQKDSEDCFQENRRNHMVVRVN